MKEVEFKEKLAVAMAEPPAPKKLVEQTVARVQVMLRGRQAEERLTKGGELSQQERLDLLADGLLGRLAQDGTLPLGANSAEMKNQLLQNDAFRSVGRMNAASLAAGLKSGSILSTLGNPPPVNPHRPSPTAAKSGPALGK